MKDQSQPRTLSLPAILATTLVLCAASVSAQIEPGSTSALQKPSPSPPTRTRTRRVVVPAGDATGATSDAGVRTEVASDPAQTKSADDGQPVTSPDSISKLRDQIASAADDQDRLRLQLELVEQLIAAGRKPDAVLELRSITAEDRFDPPGLYNVGNALARLGDTDGAAVAYRRAIAQRKGRYSRALNNLGVVLMRQGNWEDAFDALSSALKIEKFRYAEASYNLGRLYEARGETDLAIREWRRTLKLDPQHRAAAEAMASASSEDRIAVTAKSSSRRTAVSKSASDTPAALQPDSGASGGTNANASRSEKKPLSVDPETYRYLQQGREARERGKYREAVASYLRVISRMGGYFGPANLELSYVLIALNENDAALENLQQVTSRDGSRYPISYYHFARLNEFRGELKLAEVAYSQAAALYWNINPQFLLDLSRVREKLGNYQGALAALEDYLAGKEKQGQKPEWSDERLSRLKQKVAELKSDP